MNWARKSPMSRESEKHKAARMAGRKVAKQYTGTVKPKAPARAIVAMSGPVRSIPKTPDRKSQAIRDSARGEECRIRLVGVCNCNPETTVWCHLPISEAGRGGALKGLDELGCYGCSACHDVVDGRAPRPPGMTRESVLLDFLFGMARSFVRLKQKGLV
jgi:hypothetical protein